MEPFKLIIAGSRDFKDYQRVLKYLKDTQKDANKANYTLEIVCGMARGADMLGLKAADELGIPIHEFPADWDQYGKAAGYIRNSAMGNFADGAVVYWDGKSRGSKNMIDIMHKLHKPVEVERF